MDSSTRFKLQSNCVSDFFPKSHCSAQHRLLVVDHFTLTGVPIHNKTCVTICDFRWTCSLSFQVFTVSLNVQTRIGAWSSGRFIDMANLRQGCKFSRRLRFMKRFEVVYRQCLKKRSAAVHAYNLHKCAMRLASPAPLSRTSARCGSSSFTGFTFLHCQYAMMLQ